MDKHLQKTILQPTTTLLAELWMYGVIASVIIIISNLVLFLILRTNQMLAVSAAALLSLGLFLTCRFLKQKNKNYASAITGSLSWVVLVIAHELFWSGIFGLLLLGLWLLPIFIFLNLPKSPWRLSVFLPPLISVALLFLMEQSPIAERISATDFSIGRFLAPIYFFIVGILIFLVVLRGPYTRLLSTRMILSMATIVFIPIVILTMVAYSNTKLNDTVAAINSLDQIAAQKEEDVSQWASNLSKSLANILGSEETYTLITQILIAHEQGDQTLVINTRRTLEPLLNEVVTEYEMEEIYIMDTKGIVVSSSRTDLIRSDYRYYEFFWQGASNAILLPPRYYPPEDEVSLFVSRPIRTYPSEIAGVISARVSAENLINIIIAPSIQPYATTLSYLVNAGGELLISAEGRPDLAMETDGAKMVLESLEDGSGSYNNIDHQPIVGVYHWLPDLQVGILVEASQEEIYQRLPGVVASNLAIGSIAFLLAAFAAVTIVRSITTPIEKLVNASQEVISGNLDVEVETDREDELGLLSSAFKKMTSELKVLVTGLESRVAERTKDLEQRSLELQTAAVIARDASLASDISELLNRTARLIRERFGYYHVGVFLNDTNNEYTVLRAAAGDAGQVLLLNNHKLRIGETGIVGTVSGSGEPRIALDVGADAVYFRNPLLPYTRSEMALPLKVGEQVIGVLDVQSEKVNAYDQNDITIMSILTDQLSIAIERTKLIQESGQNAAAMEIALQTQTSRAWREYLSRAQKVKGYRYSGVQVEPISANDLNSSSDNNDGGKASKRKGTGRSGADVKIPIQLRNMVIGNINLHFSSENIPANTRHFIEEASNRLSLALENARLFQDAQHFATQEQQINIITGRIQQSTELETILQNTIKELGKSLGVPKTFIQIGFEKDDQTDIPQSEEADHAN